MLLQQNSARVTCTHLSLFLSLVVEANVPEDDDDDDDTPAADAEAGGGSKANAVITLSRTTN